MSGLELDPLKFAKIFFPDVKFYKDQKKIIQSVLENDETFCIAGNETGKSFCAAFCVIWWFCTRRPSRIVCTSVSQAQMEDVLWSEVLNFIAMSKYKLPILSNYLLLKQLKNDGTVVPGSEVRGVVVKKSEGLLGRHQPRGINNLPTCLCIFDECSAIPTETYLSTTSWSHHRLCLSNPNPCANFFYSGVREGDIKSPDGKFYWRKILKIKAEESPNVRLAVAEIASGKEPSHKQIVPGVVSYADYTKRRQMWDEPMQSVGLDAEFWEGKEALMFPPAWLDEATTLPNPDPTQRVVCGVDSAEGNDASTWCCATKSGVLELLSKKTTDTAEIVDTTKVLMLKYNIIPQDIYFDRGGGGQQHVDRLRREGHNCVSVGFGERATPPKKLRRGTLSDRRKNVEAAYVYKNKRAELYGLLRLMLDPQGEHTFKIPKEILHKEREDGGSSLYEQLRILPLQWDDEGRLFLPPKRKPANSAQPSLIKILGCSPDESDALALAAYALNQKTVCRGGLGRAR